MKQPGALATLLIAVGCKGSQNGARPAPAPPPPQKPAPSPDLKLPGPCAALPADDTSDEDRRDFDGDGVKDVMVADGAASCDPLGCPRRIYIVRGSCGYDVGTIYFGYPPDLKLLATKSHGLFDVSITSDVESAIFQFDGQHYVEQEKPHAKTVITPRR